MNTIKKFFNNNFIWYLIMAITSAFISYSYIIEQKKALGIAWAVIAIGDAGIAWLNRKGE